MSIIEQAARRLEELRRSGVELPETGFQLNEGAAPVRLKPLPGLAARDPGRGASLHPPVDGSHEAVNGGKRVEIDLARLATMGYLTPNAPRGQIADEFRVIKRPLLNNVRQATGNKPGRTNVIMVTSSLPGEGKTFVAVNLAISLAMEVDKTVLLVDSDVSRPSVLERFGLSAQRGLLDLLTDTSLGLDDVVLRTSIDKLSILPAGTHQSHSTELLASAGMHALVDELASRYPDRIIVFDAPPLLPSTESRVLAAQMGQVALVVEADRTPQQVVSRALSMLDACPIVMPLLNKISRSEVGSYYGYYSPTQS